jgi:hypothetical protein
MKEPLAFVHGLDLVTENQRVFQGGGVGFMLISDNRPAQRGQRYGAGL